MGKDSSRRQTVGQRHFGRISGRPLRGEYSSDSLIKLNIKFPNFPLVLACQVCLRDNFELLEDEYFESWKREEVLKSKIDELRKNPMFQVKNLY